MKRIVPYTTVAGALKALDNGGRFYHLFTKSDDGQITDGELAKAAGVISDRNKALLFFTLALSRLNRDQEAEIISHLSPDLRPQYANARSLYVDLPRFETVVRPAQPAVVEGYPRFLEDRTEFCAFIMVPISVGKVVTFTMIPIFDRFDVYELYACPELEGSKTVIATLRGSKRLKMTRTILGGIVRELKFKPKTEKLHRYFIEASYYIEDAEPWRGGEGNIRA